MLSMRLVHVLPLVVLVIVYPFLISAGQAAGKQHRLLLHDPDVFEPTRAPTADTVEMSSVESLEVPTATAAVEPELIEPAQVQPETVDQQGNVESSALVGPAASEDTPEPPLSKSSMLGGPVTPQRSTPGSSPNNPFRYTLVITSGIRSPDCVSRKVILINGQYQPTLTFTQGHWVEVTVTNNIDASAWPSLFEGISIHWHGFSMKGFPWMDGVKYVSHCPIPSGSSFKYRFKVDEMPGTYFYHDHSSMNRADGLQGPLIVKERSGCAPLVASSSDNTLFLSDHWHFAGNSMAMRLNRPFDPAKGNTSTPSGGWCWVGLPKSLLINGVGNYYDCEDPYNRQVGQMLPYRPANNTWNTTAADVLAPNQCVAGQLGGGAQFTGCDVGIGNSRCNNKARTTITVSRDKVNRIRLVNAATLVYMTVCFEKHDVTVIALDAAPVEPRTFRECVDINSGQRVDLLLTSNQPAGSYWISVGSQYRKGAPSAYGVLRYTTTGVALNPANIVSPAAAVGKLWSIDIWNGFKANAALLSSTATNNPVTAAYLAPNARGRDSFKLPTTEITKRIILKSTQPIIQVNGMLRWAFDNVAHASTPPCKPVLDSVKENAAWAQAPENAATTANTDAYWGKLGGTTNDLYSATNAKLELVDASVTSTKDFYLDMLTPSAGTHVLTVQPGEMIEIVIQNMRAGFGGGEYASGVGLTNNRNGKEQHSMHAHGYHVWQVGMGLGAWNQDNVTSYNLEDPPMRDTVTVLFNSGASNEAGWVAFRFLANNPGVWPLHCHIDWHMFMGQGINIISDPTGIGALTKPTGMPTCKTNCMLNDANFNPTAVSGLVGGMAAPPDNNLSPQG